MIQSKQEHTSQKKRNKILLTTLCIFKKIQTKLPRPIQYSILNHLNVNLFPECGVVHLDAVELDRLKKKEIEYLSPMFVFEGKKIYLYCNQMKHLRFLSNNGTDINNLLDITGNKNLANLSIQQKKSLEFFFKNPFEEILALIPNSFQKLTATQSIFEGFDITLETHHTKNYFVLSYSREDILYTLRDLLNEKMPMSTEVTKYGESIAIVISDNDYQILIDFINKTLKSSDSYSTKCFIHDELGFSLEDVVLTHTSKAGFCCTIF